MSRMQQQLFHHLHMSRKLKGSKEQQKYGKEKMKGHKKIYKKIDMVSFYKSIVDQDRASVVICNLKHEIIYMNPAAVISYAKRGGDKLIGRRL